MIEQIAYNSVLSGEVSANGPRVLLEESDLKVIQRKYKTKKTTKMKTKSKI